MLAGLLLTTGLVVLIYYLTLPGKPLNLLFATETPSSIITPLPTSTNTATKEPKPSQTPSATLETVPEFLDEFLASEYRKIGYQDGSIFGVIDQSKTLYPKEDKGVMYKGSTLFGFSEVYFVDPDTKKLTKGYVIEGICTPISGSFYCFMTGSDSITVDNIKPSLAFFKSITQQMRGNNAGDQPTVKLDFSSTIPSLDEVFNNIFGPSTGKLKWIEIPGVGKVLNVRQYSEVMK